MGKKTAFLMLLFIPSFLWAHESIITDEDGNYTESIQPVTAYYWDWVYDWEKEPELKREKRKKKGLGKRTVELSMANINLNISNNFISARQFLRSPFEMLRTKEIFNETVSINLNDFFGGFTVDFDTTIKPFSFNFNWINNYGDEWGFGLDIAHINVMGNVLLSGNLLSFNEAKNDKFGVGAAVFTEIGIPVHFRFEQFTFRIRPAVYIPLVYTEPNIVYSYYSHFNEKTGIDGMRFDLQYDIRLYSVIDMGNTEDDYLTMLMDNVWNIARNNTGYDFELGVEYAWNEKFDIGVHIDNIPVPFLTAKLHNYVQYSGNMYVDTSIIDINTMIDEGMLPEELFYYSEPEFRYLNDSDGKRIYRPFAMLFYADYRFFNTRILSIIPSLGFSISRLYPRIAAVEGGLRVRSELGNIFFTTIGMNYNDRKWKHSLDFALNLHIFQIELGLSLQSSDFVKSFQGAGLGINLGIKVGL